MSGETYVARVTVGTNTIVKRVIVGTPIKSVRASGSDLNIVGDSGTGTVSVGSAQTLTFDGVAPLTAKVGVVDNKTVTFTADNATGQTVGVAKFDSDHFNVDVTGNVRLNMLDSSDQVTHSLIPDTDSAYDLGSATNKWRKLFISGKTIELGNLNLRESNGEFSATVAATGVPVAINLDGNTTNDLSEGSNNLYYTRARIDSALGDAVSVATIRSYFQAIDAAGDGTFQYDSDTGTFTYSGITDTQVRSKISVDDQGGDGSLSYDAPTGVITYNGPSAAEVRAHFQALDLGGDGSFSYDSATGNFSYTGPSATEVRSHFQAIDAGGDGSFSYDSATGTLTYTGPSASEVRSHLVAGTGVTYDSSAGTISIGQPVATTDNVTFANITGTGNAYIAGNLTVQGTTTTVNSTEVTINDKNIVLADSAVNNADIDGGGLTLGGALYTGGTKPTFTYTVSNDRWATNKSLNVSGAVTADSATFTNLARSSPAGVTAATYGSASLVPIVTVDASGFIDSIGTSGITVPTFGTDYVDSATVSTIITTDVDSAYIAARIGGPFIDSAYFDANVPTFGTDYVDSATVSTIITADVDSAYIAARIGGPFIDSAYFDANVPTFGTDYVDSAFVTSQIVSALTWDSSTGSLTVQSGAGTSYVAPVRGFGDNVSLAFGDASDATINRNPTNLVIRDSTGGIYIEAQDIYLSSKNNGNPIWLQAGADDGVRINDSSGNLRIQTVSTGAKVYGSLTVGATYIASGDLETDSADIHRISGSVAKYGSLLGDSATISQLSADSAHIGIIDNNTLRTNSLDADSAVVTDISGVTLNYGTGQISQLTSDSASITSLRVSDSATIGQVNFRMGWTDSHIGFQEGALWYDPHHKNLNYYTDFDHPIELGMQMIERVYNNTGVEIAKGKPLYYAGNYINDSGRESPLVALADATDAAKYNVQGLSAEAIPNGSYGQIVVAGVIDKIDTSSLTAGDNVFLGLTPGALQNAAPVYPNYPMCIGWVIKSDPNNGKIIINQQNHSVPSFRVQNGSHIGGDLVIDGDLTVVGTQTITSTANVEIGGNIQYLNAGDTIGEAGTTFVGTGLDDAFFSGHYSGDSATKSFFVKIDATGTPDTFEWGFDSAVGTEATGIAITGAAQILDSAYGIEIDFGATTGHTLGDKWTGTATATDIDTGFFSNRNDSAYTHVGLYFDVSENKWTFLNRYDPEPDAPINTAAAGTQFGVVKATTFEGGLSGNVTGNVTGALTGNADTATTLATNRNFSASGDATAPNVAFNGSAAVDLVLTLATVNSNVGSFGSSTQVPAITVNGKGLITAVTATNIDHDALTNFVANEHIDHTSVSITAGTGLAGGGTIASTRDLAIDSAEFLAYFNSSIVHDNLDGFVANEHIDHSSVSITAGTGLTGGGTIASTRDLAIDSSELNAYFGGAGKGFDADTLDGQEGTYYRINVYNAAGSLLN